MHPILIAITTFVAVVLIHFSYVDFRFRYRDGMLWLWLLKPAPPLMWAARATLVVALLAALSGPIVGTTAGYVCAVGALMALHILSLVLLEVLEPR